MNSLEQDKLGMTSDEACSTGYQQLGHGNAECRSVTNDPRMRQKKCLHLVTRNMYERYCVEIEDLAIRYRITKNFWLLPRTSFCLLLLFFEEHCRRLRSECFGPHSVFKNLEVLQIELEINKGLSLVTSDWLFRDMFYLFH